ncbi:hypothetical protein GCM10009804_06730 [Kribbella hippodromi]|uniref:DUF4288 domain-containing protein n=1 Tax=Kribbella hippodromi TaxID=434347 RepID=A0ABN2C4B8_9ACTN
MTTQDGPDWYAVRCVIRGDKSSELTAYEERITLWQARSLDHAIERAEAEAREYAMAVTGSPNSYLGLAQAYHLADAPGDGAEVFSLIRQSKHKAQKYLDRFFDTGTEHQQRA